MKKDNETMHTNPINRYIADKNLIRELEQGRWSGETEGYLSAEEVRQHLNPDQIS